MNHKHLKKWIFGTQILVVSNRPQISPDTVSCTGTTLDSCLSACLIPVRLLFCARASGPHDLQAPWGIQPLHGLSLEVIRVPLTLLVRTSHMAPSWLQRELGNVGVSMDHLLRITFLLQIFFLCVFKSSSLSSLSLSLFGNCLLVSPPKYQTCKLWEKELELILYYIPCI